MSKDEIQKVTLGTNEALRVTADGEFIWHPEADAMIEEGDFTSSPAMRHILRALRKALAAPVQEPYKGLSDHLAQATNGRVFVDPVTGDVGIETPAAPDLQAELDATNRQVEILSDALAESRRQCKWPTCKSEEYQQVLAEQIKQELVTGAAQQEPVAWVDWVNAVMSQAQVFASTWSLVGGRFDDGSAYDQAEEAKQELRTMLATPPAAQRQWVGLDETDIGDEYVRFEIQGGFNRFEYAVRAIEAKLKEKNNG
jgi:hypothetical protein